VYRPSASLLYSYEGSLHSASYTGIEDAM